MQIVNLVPDNPVGYTNLGALYYLQGRESDAAGMFKKSINARPTPIAYSNLATIYFSQGRYSEALPILQKIVAEGTNQYMHWGNLADAYRWTGHSKEAVTA